MTSCKLPCAGYKRTREASFVKQLSRTLDRSDVKFRLIVQLMYLEHGLAWFTLTLCFFHMAEVNEIAYVDSDVKVISSLILISCINDIFNNFTFQYYFKH